jgi:hypothetical protein
MFFMFKIEIKTFTSVLYLINLTYFIILNILLEYVTTNQTGGYVTIIIAGCVFFWVNFLECMPGLERNIKLSMCVVSIMGQMCFMIYTAITQSSSYFCEVYCFNVANSVLSNSSQLMIFLFKISINNWTIGDTLHNMEARVRVKFSEITLDEYVVKFAIITSKPMIEENSSIYP